MRRERRWPIPFLDFQTTLLVYILGLFAIVIFVVSDAETSKKIDTTSRILITLTWKDGSDSDIDLSLKTPTGEVVWFRSKQATFASLDHDNLGTEGNVVVDASGNTVIAHQRDEVIFVRATIEGTYTVNVMAYTLLDIEDVTVTLVTVDPKWKQVAQRKLQLVERHQEETAFRFSVDAEGQITGTDTTPELFINDLLAGKPIQ